MHAFAQISLKRRVCLWLAGTCLVTLVTHTWHMAHTCRHVAASLSIMRTDAAAVWRSVTVTGLCPGSSALVDLWITYLSLALVGSRQRAWHVSPNAAINESTVFFNEESRGSGGLICCFSLFPCHSPLFSQPPSPCCLSLQSLLFIWSWQFVQGSKSSLGYIKASVCPPSSQDKSSDWSNSGATGAMLPPR